MKWLSLSASEDPLRLRSALVFAGLSLLSITVAADEAPNAIARKVLPSTVVVTAEDRYGHPKALGTGFFVRPGVVVSCLHVLRGAERASVRGLGQAERLPIIGVLQYDARHDLVLAHVNWSNAPPVILVPVAASPSIGDTVYSVGNPRGLEGTFAQGLVSGVRQFDGSELLQITAPISPGSSGGPIVNGKSQLVGIALGTIQDGQSLNFAIPVLALRTLVANLDAAPASVALMELNGGRSRPQFIAQDTKEGVEVGSFLWHYTVFDASEPTGSGKSHFSISIRNKLKTSIHDVQVLVIFHDADDQPIDVALVQYEEAIPPALGKRARGQTDSSVRTLTSVARAVTADAEQKARELTRSQLKAETEHLETEAKELAKKYEMLSGEYRKALDAGSTTAASPEQRERAKKQAEDTLLQIKDVEPQLRALKQQIQEKKAQERELALKPLTSQSRLNPDAPTTKLEFRVLDFVISER